MHTYRGCIVSHGAKCLLPFGGLLPAPGPVRPVHKRPDDSHGVRIVHPPARTHLLPTHTHTRSPTREHTHSHTHIHTHALAHTGIHWHGCCV